jgi:hypothetical protein
MGQEILNTNSGQRILLVDDGSWRLISETEIITDNTIEKGTSLNSFKSPKQGKYPVTPDQQEEIQNLLTNFMSDEAQLLVNIEMSKRELKQLKAEKSLLDGNKEKTIKIESQIRQTEASIRDDEADYSTASNLIELSNKLLEGKIKNIEKSLVTLTSKYNAIRTISSGMGGASTGELPKTTEKVGITKLDGRPLYPTSFETDDSKRSEDNYDCEIVFDGYDTDIGADRKEVKTQSFFGFTQEKLKPYFKTDDYLNCDANISKVGKKYFLTLKITIRSKDANKNYGALKANENIKIQLINGRSVYGLSINTDEGQIESYTGHTVYTGIYQLDKGDINDLKKHFVDYIGIIWSSGYEQYDIYNVDLLTNQIKCLNK